MITFIMFAVWNEKSVKLRKGYYFNVFMSGVLTGLCLYISRWLTITILIATALI